MSNRFKYFNWNYNDCQLLPPPNYIIFLIFIECISENIIIICLYHYWHYLSLHLWRSCSKSAMKDESKSLKVCNRNITVTIYIHTYILGFLTVRIDKSISHSICSNTIVQGNFKIQSKRIVPMLFS